MQAQYSTTYYFFWNTVPFKSIGTVLLEKKIYFWIFFVLSACLETTRKVSEGISLICQEM